MCKFLVSSIAVVFVTLSLVQSSAAQRSSDGWIVLRVPNNSVVYINGLRTSTKGSQRHYMSRRLQSGSRYSYTIRVVVEQNGQKTEETKKLVLTAGRTVNLTFDLEEMNQPNTVRKPLEARGVSTDPADLDLQVQKIISESLVGKPWAMANLKMEVAPDSRFFDATPPSMPNRKLENPAWRQHLPEYATVADGVLVLSLDDAVRVALIHSPQYQQQLDAVYSAALSVIATSEKARESKKDSAERALMASLRAVHRYRQGFYTQITIGDLGVQGPGNIEGNGRANGERRQTHGYFGLLRQQQSIRNLTSYLASLRSDQSIVESIYKADRIDFLQVLQVRERLFEVQTQLLSAKNDYKNRVDDFKIVLGLPPNLEVKIEDLRFDGYELNGASTVQYRKRFADVQEEINVAISELIDLFRDGREIKWDRDLVDNLGRCKTNVAKVKELCKELVMKHLPSVQKELARLEASIPRRTDDLKRLIEDINTGGEGLDIPYLHASVFDHERLKNVPTEHNKVLTTLAANLKNSEGVFEALEKDIAGLAMEGKNLADKELRDRLRQIFFTRLPSEISNLGSSLDELSILGTRIRLGTLGLSPPVQLSNEEAVAIARANRLDWANKQEELVHAWRSLKSEDLPEQNVNPIVLRNRLIEYQQLRRQLLHFEDRVEQNIRQLMRELAKLRLELEIKRYATESAIWHLDLARMRLQQPPRPGGGFQANLDYARNLLTSSSGFQEAQNALQEVCVNYHGIQLRLWHELGVMRIDENGKWVEEILEKAAPDAKAAPPERLEK
ncbi:MAG: TIGR03000 domain-containing protein [Planctomycetes bacterium]|nr:TIGR03000 domain-containing protein [Planctomycetota bacterium]